jgi:hypothetical protein
VQWLGKGTTLLVNINPIAPICHYIKQETLVAKGLHNKQKLLLGALYDS